MCVKLSKNDTLKIIFENNKINNFTNLYNFTTKYPWNCLNCNSQIFISYKQFHVNSIYCKKCISKFVNNKDKNLKLLQSHYIRLVKEKQIEIIEKYIK